MKLSMKLFTLLILLVPALAPALSAAWTLETVDTAGNVGKYSSIGTDAFGHSHICYFDVTNLTLKYATNASGSWVTETVDTVAFNFGDCSLALDGNGAAHISYAYGTSASLKYATNKTGLWVTEDLSSSSDIGYNNSIAVDQWGHVHIAYMQWYSLGKTYNLKYTTNATGSWKSESVDNSNNNDVGYDNSIAVDALGNVHLSYNNWPDQDLIYAKRTAGGSWTLEVVEWHGYYPSVKIDSSNNPHIGYVCFKDLKHAVKEGGTWTLDTVVTVFKVEHLSLGIDSLDRLHIGYQDEYIHDLHHATNASGSWTMEIVDGSKYAGEYCSLAIGPLDSIHISYMDGSNDDLKYAVCGDPLPLICDVIEISEAVGGTANFNLEGGAGNAGRDYILLGSISGTVPGTPLPGGLITLPLNLDAVTYLILGLINTPAFSNFQSQLDGGGSAAAQMNLSPVPGAAGLTLYFAYALNPPWDFVSNPVSIDFVP